MPDKSLLSLSILGLFDGFRGKKHLDDDDEDTLATYELARDGVVIEVFDLVSPGADGRNRFAIRFDEIDAIRPMTPEENRQYYASLVSNTMRIMPLRAKIASDENGYESGKINRPSYYSMHIGKKVTKGVAMKVRGSWDSVQEIIVPDAGVPVIIEGPNLFYYLAFRGKSPEDVSGLVVTFEDYKHKKTQQ
ncbi:MAG TPA: hypothetical protein VGK13_04055 [Methanocellaceae archaeon]